MTWSLLIAWLPTTCDFLISKVTSAVHANLDASNTFCSGNGYIHIVYTIMSNITIISHQHYSSDTLPPPTVSCMHTFIIANLPSFEVLSWGLSSMWVCPLNGLKDIKPVKVIYSATSLYALRVSPWQHVLPLDGFTDTSPPAAHSFKAHSKIRLSKYCWGSIFFCSFFSANGHDELESSTSRSCILSTILSELQSFHTTAR